MKLSFFLSKILAAVVAVIVAGTPLFQENTAALNADRDWQVQHIAALKAGYTDGTIAPVDERSFFDGDLDAALASGLKFNELQCVATHNSYKNESVPRLRWWYKTVNRLTFGAVPADGGSFQAQPLCAQLDGGIRSLELDVETIHENGGTRFVCIHSPVLDMTTNSYDFALALAEIKLWSDANPGHLPVTVIIEPKTAMLPMENMDFFTLDNAVLFDALLRDVLGDTLFTPADMLRGYGSFAAMRQADDWCTVQEMRGKVLVLLHKNVVTGSYIRQDKTLRTQAMFPMLRPAQANKPYASFLIQNDPEKISKSAAQLLRDGKFILRTRADSYGSVSEDTRAAAAACGAQLISTDYPPLPGEMRAFAFANGATVRQRNVA